MFYFYKSLNIVWRQEKKWLIVSIFNSIVLGLIPVTTVWVLQKLVNSVMDFILPNSGNYLLVLAWLSMQLILSTLSNAIREYQNYIDRKTEENLEISFQERVLTKVTSVPIIFFDSPDFYNKIERSSRNLGGKFLNPIKSTFNIFRDLITFITIFSYLFSIHWLLAILSIIVAVPIFLIQSKLGLEQYLQFFYQTPISREVQYIKYMLKDRNTAKEIRLFGVGDYFISKWKSKSVKILAQSLKLLRKGQYYSVAGEGITALFYLISAILMVYLIQNNSLTVGEFVAIGQAIQSTQTSINNIARGLGKFKEYNGYIKDYYDFIDYKMLNELPAGTEKFPHPLLTGISFKNVTFSYLNNSVTVLKNINLHIKSGEKVAIVGENGSGKSTFVKCLSGLYPVTNGEIYFDDKKINSIDKNELFKNITVVFQDFIKYPYTVKENIRLGDINKNEDTIEFVGREANVNSFVDKFPNRYDTFLGKILEDGEDLSGGQWQKLALARALFKEGEIYILDEPTAALDPLSELEIFEKFEFITKSKTSFFISHRIASTKFADRILVFKEGEIIENGSHKELMELKGEYYKLYEAQSKWYSTSELVTNI